MVVVGRAQAPPHLGNPPPTAENPPYSPQPTPPPPTTTPRVLTDSWGVCRIRTGCSRPPPVVRVQLQRPKVLLSVWGS